MLRPSADISLGHPVYPETLGAGYLAISEEISDGTSTYIGVTSAPDSALTFASNFAMSPVSLGDQKVAKILTATLRYDGYVYVGNDGTAYCNCSVKVSNDDAFSASDKEQKTATGGQGGRTNTLSNADMPDVANSITSHLVASGELPSVTAYIENYTDKDNGTKYVRQSYVSQLAIELICEFPPTDIGIYHKTNGAWLAATAAYRKRNGAWVEITADECKSVLVNSLCLGGAK